MIQASTSETSSAKMSANEGQSKRLASRVMKAVVD